MDDDHPILKRIHLVMRLILFISLILLYLGAGDDKIKRQVGSLTQSFEYFLRGANRFIVHDVNEPSSLLNKFLDAPIIELKEMALTAIDNDTSSLKTDLGRISLEKIEKIVDFLRRTTKEHQETLPSGNYITHNTKNEMLEILNDINKTLSYFKKIANKYKLQGQPAINDIVDYSTSIVKLPYARDPISKEIAIQSIFIGFFFVYLYLYSLIGALRHTIKATGLIISDWVFLHPGIIGIFIGVNWLFLPIITFFFLEPGDYSFQDYNLLTQMITFCFLIVLCFVIFMALRNAILLRYDAQDSLKRYKKNEKLKAILQ